MTAPAGEDLRALVRWRGERRSRVAAGRAATAACRGRPRVGGIAAAGCAPGASSARPKPEQAGGSAPDAPLSSRARPCVLLTLWLKKSRFKKAGCAPGESPLPPAPPILEAEVALNRGASGLSPRRPVSGSRQAGRGLPAPSAGTRAFAWAGRGREGCREGATPPVGAGSREEQGDASPREGGCSASPRTPPAGARQRREQRTF